MSANYFVDLHVLQTVPPSCVNRDDTNSPKVATYGGTLRSRVSSQAWKHAMRESFTSLFSEEALGKRTKHIVEIVEKEIMSQQPNLNVQDIENDVIDLLTKAGLSVNSKTKASDTLCFISKKQAEALAYVYLNRPKDEKAYTKMIKEAIKNNPSVDMALFGRMIASDASLNYDACAQVAHAISTHEVHTEYDYFTAVDDCSPDRCGEILDGYAKSDDRVQIIHLQENRRQGLVIYSFDADRKNEHICESDGTGPCLCDCSHRSTGKLLRCF